ncbi:MAG TPA: alpha-L-rhamnosidase C-terminal domain-containing protein, partial [Puia sp.]|nr:alpha-L-rhamnosidase C-terminal domain-containing protein [Puia sp.]
ADLETGYGRVGSHWSQQGDTLLMDVLIPANTTATIAIPAPEGGRITESNKSLALVKELSIESVERGYLILKAGSGTYHFKVTQ